MKNLSKIASAAAARVAEAVENNAELKTAAGRLKRSAKDVACQAAEDVLSRLGRKPPVSTVGPEEVHAIGKESLLKKLPPIPVGVSEAQLNRLAAKAITEDGRIESLAIQCRRGGFTLTGSLSLAGLKLNFTTDLDLQSCEFNAQRKVITLRRLDKIPLGGDGMLASFMARVVKIVICGLFGADLAAISLKDVKGINVSENLITADLEAMGAMDAVITGLRQKLRDGIAVWPVGPLVRLGIEPVLDIAGPALLARLRLENVSVTENGVHGELFLGKEI